MIFKIILFVIAFTELNINDVFQFEDSLTVPQDVIFRSFLYGFVYIESDLYCFSRQIDKNCSITFSSLDSLKKKEIVLRIPDSLFKYQCHRYEANIVVCNDSLFVQLADIIILYSINSSNCKILKIYMLNEIFKKDIKYYCTRIKVINGIIFGINDVFKPKNSNTDDFYYFFIDTKSDKNGFHSIDRPKGFYWTLFRPRVILDINMDNILVSNVTEYNFQILDRNNFVVDSLKRDIKNWKSKTYSLDEINNKEPRELINKLQKDTSTTSLIHNAQFINDSTILICYSITIPEDNSIYLYHEYYDIWIKDKNKWVLFINDIDSQSMLNNSDNSSNSALGRDYQIINNMILSFHNNFDNPELCKIILRNIIR